MFKKFRRIWLVAIVIVLGIGVYFLPPVNDRLAGRLDDLIAQVRYYFNPPDKAVFQPAQSQQDAINAVVSATMQAYTLAQTSTPASALDPTSTQAGPTPSPTVTPLPLPAAVSLPGVVYMNQEGGWNL